MTRLLVLAALFATVDTPSRLPVTPPGPALPPGAAGFLTSDGGTVGTSDTALYTLNGGRVVRRDPRTWRSLARTEASTLRGPIVPAGPRVYTLDAEGAVVALDAQTLKRTWTATLAGPPQALVPAGEVVVAVRPTALPVLDARTGRQRSVLRDVDAAHHAQSVQVIGGLLLVHHVPGEGFQGEVFTAHDPATGRPVWTQRVGHGDVLGQVGPDVVFDTRAWHNLLGERGAFSVAEVNVRTGRRRDAVRSLAGLPGTPARWRVAAGTPALEPDGTLWLVVEAPDGGGARLARVSPQGAVRLWPLPPTRPGGSDGAALAVTGQTAVVVMPNGQATTLNRATGGITSVLVPGFGGGVTVRPLGDVVGITRSRGGTVILDAASRVRIRVDEGGVPVQAGPALWVPTSRGLIAVRWP